MRGRESYFLWFIAYYLGQGRSSFLKMLHCFANQSLQERPAAYWGRLQSFRNAYKLPKMIPQDQCVGEHARCCEALHALSLLREITCSVWWRPRFVPNILMEDEVESSPLSENSYLNTKKPCHCHSGPPPLNREALMIRAAISSA